MNASIIVSGTLSPTKATATGSKTTLGQVSAANLSSFASMAVSPSNKHRTEAMTTLRDKDWSFGGKLLKHGQETLNKQPPSNMSVFLRR
jgi:hypothetical protein